MEKQSLQQTLDTLRSVSQNPGEQGALFEKLMERYFVENTIYKDGFSKVWLRGEWAAENGVPAQDGGVDLVTEKEKDELYSIQCKCYDPAHPMDKPHIDSFSTASGKKHNGRQFSERAIVSTTSKWGDGAERAIEHQSTTE